MREPMGLPTLFDERKAALLLHVKPCTVRNERVRGKLGYVRVGRQIFYTEEHIRQYLLQHSVSAVQKPSNGSNSVPLSRDNNEPMSNPGMKDIRRENRSDATSAADRRAASALAAEIFKRRPRKGRS